MMLSNRTALAACGLSCLISANVFAHPDVDDLPRNVTSDFGPRNVTCSRFHQGVDWGYGTGEPVPLIEDASVSALARGATGLVRLEIDGNSDVNHHFRYLHFFNNNAPPLFSGDFILAAGSSGALAIVKRNAANNRRADYMISSVAGDTVNVVFPGDAAATRIRNAANSADATTINSLTRAAHASVGPAGTSGGVAPHLHVDFGFDTFQNMYYHMREKNSAFNLRVLDKNNIPRLEGFVVGPNKAESSFLKIEVDSRTGLDLEEMKLYVDSAAAPNMVRQFVYGGKTTAYDPVNVDLRAVSGGCDGPDVSDGNRNGVHNFNDQTGWEHFIYNDWQAAFTAVSPSLLSEGQHTLLFRLLDIRDNVPFTGGANPEIKFNIDKTAPITSLTVKNTL